LGSRGWTSFRAMVVILLLVLTRFPHFREWISIQTVLWMVRGWTSVQAKQEHWTFMRGRVPLVHHPMCRVCRRAPEGPTADGQEGRADAPQGPNPDPAGRPTALAQGPAGRSPGTLPAPPCRCPTISLRHQPVSFRPGGWTDCPSREALPSGYAAQYQQRRVEQVASLGWVTGVSDRQLRSLIDVAHQRITVVPIFRTPPNYTPRSIMRSENRHPQGGPFLCVPFCLGLSIGIWGAGSLPDRLRGRGTRCEGFIAFPTQSFS